MCINYFNNKSSKKNVIKNNNINIKFIKIISCILICISFLMVFSIEDLLKSSPFKADYSIIPSLWGIQATISVLSITIFMMLAQKLEKRYYGLTLLEVLNNNTIKFTCFNFLENIIVCLLLVVINFINVIGNSMNGFIIIFFINSWVLVSMIVHAFHLLSDEDKCKEEAKKYINSIEIKSNNYSEWLDQLQNYFYSNKNNFSYIDIAEYIEIIESKADHIDNIENNKEIYLYIYISALYCSEYSHISMNTYSVQKYIKNKKYNKIHIHNLISIFKKKSKMDPHMELLKYFISSYISENGKIELLVRYLIWNYKENNIELNYIFSYLFIMFIKSNKHNEIEIFIKYIYEESNIEKYITFILLSLFILFYLRNDGKFNRQYEDLIINIIGMIKKYDNTETLILSHLCCGRINISNINSTSKIYERLNSTNLGIDGYFVKNEPLDIEGISRMSWIDNNNNMYYTFILYQLILGYNSIKNDIKNIDKNIIKGIIGLFETNQNEIDLKKDTKENIKKIFYLLDNDENQNDDIEIIINDIEIIINDNDENQNDDIEIIINDNDENQNDDIEIIINDIDIQELYKDLSDIYYEK